MLDDVVNLAFHSSYEATVRTTLLMIAAALFILLAIRLAMSLVSIARVKARKQWDIEPPIGKQESLLARLMRGEIDESTQQVLLTEEVRDMLAHVSTGKNQTAAISR